MNKKEKLIITLCGKSSTGKNAILNELIKRNAISPLISHTDRPIRNNEIDGDDYYFLSEEVFDDMAMKDEFIEVRTYGTNQGVWKYGLSKSEIEKPYRVAIVILDLNGYEELEEYCQNSNIKTVSIYVNTCGETRLKRAINRQSPTTEKQRVEICRRYIADYSDFEGAEDFCDYVVNNDDDLNFAVDKIEEIIDEEYKNMTEELEYNIDAIEYDLMEVIDIIYYNPNLVFNRVGDENFKIFRDHYGNLMFNVESKTYYTGQLPIFNYIQDKFKKSKTKREELL